MHLWWPVFTSSTIIINHCFMFAYRKLRRGRAQQTLFNLALSMLCSWIVFLTGIKQTHSFYGCIVVAALLHYFILSSFMWMLMEAFLQYLTFVKVLGTYVTRYTLKTVLIAWGKSQHTFWNLPPFLSSFPFLIIHSLNILTFDLVIFKWFDFPILIGKKGNIQIILKLLCHFLFIILLLHITGLPLVPVISILSIDYTLYSGGSR